MPACKLDRFFCHLLRQSCLSTHKTEYCSVVQSHSQAIGIGGLPGQGERLATPLPSLLWIPQEPQRPSEIAQARHTTVHPTPESAQPALLSIIQGYPSLEMHTGRDKFAMEE